MLFEIHGLILALHYEARFLKNPGSIARANAASTTSCGATARTTRFRPARHSSPASITTKQPPRSVHMPTYTPPLRDMHFVMHEVLKIADEYKAMPRHAETDADTINAVLEEGGKFASEVIFPLNIPGDEEGCTLDKKTHEVKTPRGFKEAYAKSVEGGWPALSLRPRIRRPGPADRGQPGSTRC